MKRANTIWAALLLFANPKAFEPLAYDDFIAITLESPIYAKYHAEGTWPNDDQAADMRANNKTWARELRWYFAKALIWTACLALIALGIAYWRGIVSPELTLAPAKVLSSTGVALAAWGTMFQLGRGPDTWSGRSLTERIAPLLFMAVFVPGALLALLGAIW